MDKKRKLRKQKPTKEKANISTSKTGNELRLFQTEQTEIAYKRDSTGAKINSKGFKKKWIKHTNRKEKKTKNRGET